MTQHVSTRFNESHRNNTLDLDMEGLEEDPFKSTKSVVPNKKHIFAYLDTFLTRLTHGNMITLAVQKVGSW